MTNYPLFSAILHAFIKGPGVCRVLLLGGREFHSFAAEYSCLPSLESQTHFCKEVCLACETVSLSVPSPKALSPPNGPERGLQSVLVIFATSKAEEVLMGSLFMWVFQPLNTKGFTIS